MEAEISYYVIIVDFTQDSQMLTVHLVSKTRVFQGSVALLLKVFTLVSSEQLCFGSVARLAYDLNCSAVMIFQCLK